MVDAASGSGMVPRADLDRAEARAAAAEARLASLERQVSELRPMAEMASQIRKALAALLGAP